MHNIETASELISVAVFIFCVILFRYFLFHFCGFDLVVIVHNQIKFYTGF